MGAMNGQVILFVEWASKLEPLCLKQKDIVKNISSTLVCNDAWHVRNSKDLRSHLIKGFSTEPRSWASGYL